ncbi:cob(I)yrinic acid a,c-diamide adenosyltransferase [Candidatus Microgenomates bacterium]|nr:cob(I)yrinic acid a,c-diamide adenosyltransferase [Candidatus Microgenomates bacterium]
MPIYTRRGDTGTTRIYGSRDRHSKSGSRINALGTIDELNAQLGLVLVHCRDRRLSGQLARIQQDLFEIGAQLATAPGEPLPFTITKSDIVRLERWIDSYWDRLPPLVNFVFPGGSLSAAQLHVARTVARRAERVVVKLSKEEALSAHILAYINRLSDFLHVAARWANKVEGVEDVIWSSVSSKKK